MIYGVQCWFFSSYLWCGLSNEEECDKFNDDPHEIEVSSHLVLIFFNGDGGAVLWQSYKVLFMIRHPIRVMKWKNFFSFSGLILSRNDFREDYPMIKFIACDFCYFLKKKILWLPHFFMMTIIIVIIFSKCYWVKNSKSR